MRAKFDSYLPILLLTVGHGAVDTFGGLLQILAPGLSAHLGIPLGELIILIGAGALVSNLVQPLAGWIMSRRNLAWTLWVAVVVSSLPAFMGFVDNIWSLSVLVLVGAAATGFYHPEGVLTAHDATGEKAYLGIPLFMAGGAAIYALATPLCIAMTERRGFRELVWLLIPCLAVALAFLLSYRRRKRQHPSILIRPRSKRVTTVREGSMSYWPLLAVGFFLCMATGLFLSTLSSHFELRFGPGSRSWSGLALMAVGVGASACSFLWGSLARRRGFYPVALATQLLAFPLFLFMAYAPSPALGFAVTLPLSLVTPASLHPAAITLAKNAAGATQALRTSLIMGGAYGLSSVVVMAAGTLMRRGMGSSGLIVFVAFCSLAAAGVSAWQVLRQRRRRRLEAESVV